MWCRLEISNRQHQCAAYPCLLAELWWDYVGSFIHCWKISAREFTDERIGFFVESLCLRNTAANHHPLRRGNGEKPDNAVCEIPRFCFPGGMIDGKLLRGFPPALFDGWAAGHALQAIGVKRADPGEVITLFPWHADVA